MKGQKNKPDGCLSELSVSNSSEPYNNGPMQAGDSLNCSDLEGSNHMAHGNPSSPVKELEKGYSVEELERKEKATRGARGPYKKTKGVDMGGKGEGEYLNGGGNYYEKIQMRRQKILSFLQKDVFQINKPDLRRFMNANHAYECLLPYHIFSPLLYEDAMFVNTNEIDVVEDEIREVTELTSEVLALESRPFVMENTLVCELLLYYQQRYINSIYGKDETEIRKEEARRQKLQRRPKSQLNKRNTIFRLKVEMRPAEANNVSVRNGKLYFKRECNNFC